MKIIFQDYVNMGTHAGLVIGVLKRRKRKKRKANRMMKKAYTDDVTI
jgi:hypothetical protein